MKKDTYFFYHDYNARKDPKCIGLIKDFGMTGYGVYWCLIEVMYEQGGKIKKFPSLFSALAHEFNIREPALTKQIEAMLHKYELLLEDATHLWSNAVLTRLHDREAKRSKKIEAGKRGGIRSGLSRRYGGSAKQNEALLQTREANEAKERKGKEIKGKENNIVIGDKSPTQKSFKDFSEQDFINDLKKYESDYPKDLLNNFFSYWKEKSPGAKMRFQLERTWETKLRLKTWKNNEPKFSKNGTVNKGKATGGLELLEELRAAAAANGSRE